MRQMCLILACLLAQEPISSAAGLETCGELRCATGPGLAAACTCCDASATTGCCCPPDKAPVTPPRVSRETTETMAPAIAPATELPTPLLRDLQASLADPGPRPERSAARLAHDERLALSCVLRT